MAAPLKTEETPNVTQARERRDELLGEAQQLLQRHDGATLDPDASERFEAIETEIESLSRSIEQSDRLRAIVASGNYSTEAGADPGLVDRDPFADPRDVGTDRRPWQNAERAQGSELHHRAAAAIEVASGMTDRSREVATGRLAGLRAAGDDLAAQIVLSTTDPDYVAGFARLLRGEADLLSPEERQAVRRVKDLSRAMSVGTDAAGGYLVPEQLDPSLIFDSAGATNPVRELARKKLTSTRSATFITSTAVSASWDGEAAEVSDDTTTLAEVAVTAHKWQAFVPFSIEVEASTDNLTGELARLFADAKNTLEASAFVTGTGSDQPTGIVTALTGGSYVVASASTDTFAIADVYAIYEALAVRYRDQAAWLANELIFDDVRQFGTSDSHALWTRLAESTPERLLGRPVHSSSQMDGTITADADNYALILGDWHHYGIVDRIGLTIELVPHLFATANNRPSGQRGLYAWGMTGGDSLVDRAFAMLNVT